MPKYNLDTIIKEAISVETVELHFQGKDYKLREFVFGDLAIYENEKAQRENETNDDFRVRIGGLMKTFFEGPTPPMLDQPFPEEKEAARAYNLQFNALLSFITAQMLEVVSLPKQIARIQMVTQERIFALRSSV